jgi:hypothetical protein
MMGKEIFIIFFILELITENGFDKWGQACYNNAGV